MEGEVISKIILNGFPYEIDRKDEVLLPKETPRPAISFGAMRKEDRFYKVNINPDGDIVPDLEKFLPTPISIPAQLLDTPLVMNDAFSEAFNRHSYSEDWGVLVYDKQIRERLEGILPQIDVCGDQYIIDWRLKELRMVSDPDKSLNLRSFVLSGDGEVYQSYYNTVLRKPADLTIGITELPRNVVLLEIPNEIILDPVAVAREHGLRDTELLKHFPVADKLKAGIVSLTKTPIADWVEQNRKRVGLDDSGQQRPKM